MYDISKYVIPILLQYYGVENKERETVKVTQKYT